MPKLRKSSERIALSQLTAKQRSFAELVANGYSYAAAYRLSYDTNGRSSTIRVEASRLANSPQISLAIEALQNAHDNAYAPLGTVNELLDTLRHGNGASARLKAAQVLGRRARLF